MSDVGGSLRTTLAYVERWLAYRAWRERLPGVQYAVWFDGELQLSGAWGLADVERGVPLTPAHLFRIASHSKTFTATAVLQLEERGLLGLDDTLARHVPELADAPSGVGQRRLRDLLQHGGGLVRDGADGDHWQHLRPFPDVEQLLAMVRADGVKAPAGERFHYSNLAYSLLGLVVERVSGETFADYTRAHVAEPLGLTSVHAELDPARLAEYAVGYSGLHAAGERRPLPHVDTAAMAAATGFAGTASDVVRYLVAHRVGSGELLTDETKRRAQHRALPSAPGAERGYGLGLMVEEVGGRTLVGHSGGYPGHATKSMLDPDRGLAVSVLTNAVDGAAGELLAGVFKLLDAALTVPSRRPLGHDRPARALPVDTSAFEGRFANLWGVLDVVRLGDRLVALTPNTPDPVAAMDVLEVLDADTLLIAEGDGYGSVGETMRYHRAPDGLVTSMRGRSAMSWEPFEVPPRLS